MDKEKNYNLNKFITIGGSIFILYMFSCKLGDMILDLAKSLLIIITILLLSDYIFPMLSKKIRKILIDFININPNSDFIKNITYNIPKYTNNIHKYIKQYIPSEQSNTINDNISNTRNINNQGNLVNRKLN